MIYINYFQLQQFLYIHISNSISMISGYMIVITSSDDFNPTHTIFPLLNILTCILCRFILNPGKISGSYDLRMCLSSSRRLIGKPKSYIEVTASI